MTMLEDNSGSLQLFWSDPKEHTACKQSQMLLQINHSTSKLNQEVFISFQTS